MFHVSLSHVILKIHNSLYTMGLEMIKFRIWSYLTFLENAFFLIFVTIKSGITIV